MICIAFLWISALLPWLTLSMRADYLAHLRQETVDMFHHGFSNYMKHAFPEDELRPLTCAPLTRDRENPSHIGLNDALGNYSLTLIDSLSTLAILAGGPQDGLYTGQQALADFQNGVAQLVENYGDGRQGLSGQGRRAHGFDLDSKIQVFETVIRGVGGLLSAHLFAVGELPIAGYTPSPQHSRSKGHLLETAPILWPNGFTYDGQLLRLALDLAERLLPAFYTDTGIPYPRVNLRHGIPFYLNSPLHSASEQLRPKDGREEITETCSAGAGSLTLEFTVLSRLSGDPRFEQAAKRAFWEVWHRRSQIGLIGNGIDPERGHWIGSHSGIGAGMDSFFEYALKSYVLLAGQGPPNASFAYHHGSNKMDPNSLHAPLPPELHTSDAFLEAWHQAHASVKQYLYTDRNHYPYYSNNHRATGQPFTMWIDSLGAFYPGLLALAGEVEEAVEANLVYTALWTRYSALPERWSISLSNVEGGLGWWPGRPEFIESTYYIYRATRDPWYLHVGEMVLKDIKRRCKAPCGWAGLQDVRTGEKQDRMESFFLGETTKYMYLLFDPDHQLNKLDAAFVFSTEGHPLIIPKERKTPSRKVRRFALQKDLAPLTKSHQEGYTNTCPVPSVVKSLAGSNTAARPDLFQASRLTDLYNTPNSHGPIEAFKIRDEANHKTITAYRPTTNYTIFPWTLPPTLLPENGTCLAPPEKMLSWIEFPTNDVTNSLFSKLISHADWSNVGGPVITNIEGLKLGLEQVSGEDQDQPVWRITHAANQLLANHDNVFFDIDQVRHFQDPVFAVKRRQDAVDLEFLLDPPPVEEPTGTPPTKHPELVVPDDSQKADASESLETLLRSLFRAVTSVLEPGSHASAKTAQAQMPATVAREAFISVGPGSFPMPPVGRTQFSFSESYNMRSPRSNYQWTTIYLAGHACDGPLPAEVPRTHQAIVMLRGGCSFSDKLANIPAFPAGSGSELQIVLVLDEEPDGFTRPLLDVEQLTPNGNSRVHGVPMVLVRGERGDYETLKRAVAVGMRRKYRAESQGLRIENAVIL